MRKNILMTAMAVFVIAILTVPMLASAVPSLSPAVHRDEKTAGDTGSITYTITNDQPVQIFVTSVYLKMEWRIAPYEASISTPVGIPTGESRSFMIPYEVPENVPTTVQLGTVTAIYTQNSLPYTLSASVEITVNPPTNIWFYALIIVVIAVVIIVSVVGYLYTKKKPQVHIHKQVTQVQAEKEDPKTRIRAPAQRGSPSGATQVVGGGSGGATVVTAPGGGMEVMFPKGQKRIVTTEMVIGRQDFSNLLDSSVLPRISKSHMRIYKEGGNFFVEDGYRGKASTNGTKLNGREIRGAGPQQITSAATISISDVVDLQLTMNK